MKRLLLISLLSFTSLFGLAQSNIKSFADYINREAGKYLEQKDFKMASDAYTHGISEFTKVLQEVDDVKALDYLAHILRFRYKRAELLAYFSSRRNLTNYEKKLCYDTVMEDCKLLFNYFNSNIELLYGEITKEQVYFVRGLAKIHFGDSSHKEDFILSGEYGRKMLNDILNYVK